MRLGQWQGQGGVAWDAEGLSGGAAKADGGRDDDNEEQEKKNAVKVPTPKNFSFVTRMSFPIAGFPDASIIFQVPKLAFSADGSKFAMSMSCGTVSVWDIRSKVPLKSFMEGPKCDHDDRPTQYLQFSSGNLGKEALVFVKVRLKFTFSYPYHSMNS